MSHGGQDHERRKRHHGRHEPEEERRRDHAVEELGGAKRHVRPLEHRAQLPPEEKRSNACSVAFRRPEAPSKRSRTDAFFARRRGPPTWGPSLRRRRVLRGRGHQQCDAEQDCGADREA